MLQQSCNSVATLLLLVLFMLVRPTLHLFTTIVNDVDGRKVLASYVVDDASRLNATTVHASQKQFELAYPNAAKFFGSKRAHDPSELFQNEFYLKYGLRQDD